jgi:hypothetical protein
LIFYFILKLVDTKQISIFVSTQENLIMFDIYNLYERMEGHNIMLSFKGVITSELLSSILQIMEAKLDKMEERPKTRKKVFNVLVECLQNLYHHIDEYPSGVGVMDRKSAIFMVGRQSNHYDIITGNFILNENIEYLQERLDAVNQMDKEELKEYYKSILNNGEMSLKGGGGLGMIDIARKSGQKLNYNFRKIDDTYSFFSLGVKIEQEQEVIN